jgi:lycopene beta-cyclase
LTKSVLKSRFELYDNVLLHVIAKNVVGGAKVFENLFKLNKPAAIFRFLDEDTHFLQEYRLMNTVPILKFIGPGWKELLNLGK